MKNYWLEQKRLRIEDARLYWNEFSILRQQKKCKKRWKRLEIISGGCCSFIMKDDALDNCGAWGPEKVSIAR